MTAPAPSARRPGVPEAEVYGPRLPELRDLHLAQDAPCEANRAGCSDVVYDRLILERQQTEAAYLAGYDRELDRALEAEAAEGEWEAEWDSEDSNAYQARAEAGLEPEAEP